MSEGLTEAFKTWYLYERYIRIKLVLRIAVGSTHDKMSASRVALLETSSGTPAKACCHRLQLSCRQKILDVSLTSLIGANKVLLDPGREARNAAPFVVLATDWAAPASEVKLAALQRRVERVSRRTPISHSRV